MAAWWAKQRARQQMGSGGDGKAPRASLPVTGKCTRHAPAVAARICLQPQAGVKAQLCLRLAG